MSEGGMMNDGFCTVMCVASLVAGLIIGIIVGGCISSASFQKCAVAKGHAEYVLQGSEAVWQWKEIKETPK